MIPAGWDASADDGNQAGMFSGTIQVRPVYVGPAAGGAGGMRVEWAVGGQGEL
jgi:hypothetical protein